MPQFLGLLVLFLISSCALTPPLPTPYNPALSLPTEDDYRLVDKQDFLGSDLPWVLFLIQL